MTRCSWLALAGALGCATPDPLPTDDDPTDDTTSDDDTDIDVTCTGTWTLDLTSAPVEPEVPLGMGTEWRAGGAVFRTFNNPSGGRYGIQRDTGGCLVLGAGALGVNLLESGCAGAAVRVRATTTCGIACTEVYVSDLTTVIGTNKNSLEDVEQVLSVDPLPAFATLAVGSLDATVCAIEVERTPIPDSLRTEDTDDPF